jgi:hypothetical protein
MRGVLAEVLRRALAAPPAATTSTVFWRLPAAQRADAYSTVVEAQSAAEKGIASKLQQAFPAAIKILVRDASGGCGAMYDIEVVSADFKCAWACVREC